MKQFIFTLLPVLMAVQGCRTSSVVCSTDEFKVKVTAVSDDMVRVQAVPRSCSFPKSESLSVVCKETVPAKVSEEAELKCLETSALRVSICKKSGTVCVVRKSDGDTLTCESMRSFEPIEVDGTGGWTVRQAFKPARESFFGLGQDQTDEWDWKGRNEELYQYNTKISIPFAVSSRRYGVLWDGYSLTRWGDPRPYSQLGEVLDLYDSEGRPGALTGVYTAADGSVMVRRETSLSQEHLRTPECDVVVGAPADFDFNGSEVSFDGDIAAREDGVHNFYLYYAGYTEVYMDGVQVVPQIWRTAWNPNGRKFSLDMEKGRKVHLHIGWKPDGGVSYNALKVHSPLTPDEQSGMSWWAEMQDQIDYYVVNGDSMDDVIAGYRKLTGKAPLMPKWAMGYWQCRERYKTQDEVLETVSEFRRRGIPLDNIVQDWQYWESDQWGSHEFDPARYPDPKAMIDSVHAMDARFMISVWPKFYTGTEHFNEMDSGGWMYRAPVDEGIKDWLGYEQSFYDAYSEGARKLFWDQLNDHLWSLGVDAWWMDADEPNIHDCVDMDSWKRFCGPTALGPSTKYLNTYSLVNGMAFYEGQKSVSPDSRVFILSRNGFAGLQRYSAACWSGDIGTRWEEMKAQISAGLNFSVAGMPFWTQDIGGFSVEGRYMRAMQKYLEKGLETDDLKEWRELQTRWHEWGVFAPIYRSHGQWPFREPWNIAPEGSESYEAVVASDRLRYRLLPYIYTMAARVHFDDYTIMRPFVMDFPDDREALRVSDEYMFGDALLICPVYEYGARSRKVYLPEGSDWYDFRTGEKFAGGGVIEADAPYDHIPVFGRGGRIVVCGPDIQSSADTSDGSLTVMVYPGADAHFELYEDDGVTCGYERGEYSRIPIDWDNASLTLNIGERAGGYEGIIPERDIKVRVAGMGETSVQYSGTPVSCRL